ncbi:MAG TPA: hypothetical protein VHD87_02755 [Acidimicrobiales bacterium]|nr:hypothetical protein [Acidimicrobiales bacterium]
MPRPEPRDYLSPDPSPGSTTRHLYATARPGASVWIMPAGGDPKFLKAAQVQEQFISQALEWFTTTIPSWCANRGLPKQDVEKAFRGERFLSLHLMAQILAAESAHFVTLRDLDEPHHWPHMTEVDANARNVGPASKATFDAARPLIREGVQALAWDYGLDLDLKTGGGAGRGTLVIAQDASPDAYRANRPATGGYDGKSLRLRLFLPANWAEQVAAIGGAITKTGRFAIQISQRDPDGTPTAVHVLELVDVTKRGDLMFEVAEQSQ